jgi:hypothetical protein
MEAIPLEEETEDIAVDLEVLFFFQWVDSVVVPEEVQEEVALVVSVEEVLEAEEQVEDGKARNTGSK